MGTSNKGSCKTAAVMNLLGKGPTVNQPAPVEGPQLRDIEVITSEILEAKRTGGEAILTIGRGLMEAKAQLSHGEWLLWLGERVEIKTRVAQRCMLLAQKYSNASTLTYLGASKAIELLAIPDEEERDEFIEVPHVVNGEEKMVGDMSVRELKALMKERDDALKAADQAKADQSAAEAARKKMAEDMALANERIEGLNAEVEEQTAKAKEAQDAAARLEQELEELRSRPVEVAVEADAAAVEAARKEAEERMQAQLDEIKKAWEEAEKARKSAEESASAAQKKLEKAQAEAQAIREQAQKAERRAALAAKEDLVLFRTLFDQSKELANKMGGVLMKVRNKDPETAQGLSNALVVLANQIQEVAAQ